MKLQVDHVDLCKGIIYIPSRGQRLSRYISLESLQIMQLHDYIKTTRELYKQEASDKLFSPQADNYSQLHYQYKELSKWMKEEAKPKLDLQLTSLGIYDNQEWLSGSSNMAYVRHSTWVVIAPCSA